MTFQPPFAIVAVSTLLSYFIGGLPFGYWFVRFSTGKDIRTMGSGNIGATNVHRSAGKKAGLIVLFLDILKGFLAIWLAAFITGGNPLGLALAVVAVMLGHCYPLLLGFKGGKAVACFIGAFLYLAPLALVATALVFVAVVILSKHISLGSIIGASIFPFIFWFIKGGPRQILVASIFSCALIIYRHKANIARLRAGSESVFSIKGQKE